ncbi:hypothetical protein HELRODRAFT_74949, partial [Helobdella robusta]|uniref:Helicase POLQ-like n=1 Tax=Helobdella robusta TaxID=6412 RepID=T1G1Y2_HELRO
FFGLPSELKKLLWIHRNISDLYEWQKECLMLEHNSAGRNLIYSLPTSGGKTLVAEVLIIKQLIVNKKNALFILPYVAIVQEKVKSLSILGVDLNFLVHEYAGSKGRLPPVRHRKQSLYIATIEKSASIVNSLIEDDRLSEIGLVVVDELHMIGDGTQRGVTLESTLTKFIHCSASTQIVGMSATLNNIEDLQAFLQALIYTNDFRPKENMLRLFWKAVELKEYVKVSDVLYEVRDAMPTQVSPTMKDYNCIHDSLTFKRVIDFQYSKEMLSDDPDHLYGLTMEVVPAESCLIFCHSKKNCENVALLICHLIEREVMMEERKELVKNLRDENEDICDVLRKTVKYGVAYHHSGLTSDERLLIEEAYLNKTLCVLVCTSTLAAGVNLPAKRVILRSPFIGRQMMTRTQYKQMIGRAGRAGFHSSGESILIAKQHDIKDVKYLIQGACESCYSSLSCSYLHKQLSNLVLTCVGLKVTRSISDVLSFLKKTLCYQQLKQKNEHARFESDVNLCLINLIGSGLIVEKFLVSLDDDNANNHTHLEVSKFGRAVFKGSIDLNICKLLYDDLKANQSNVVLSSYLHLIFLITPYEHITNTSNPLHIDWWIYINEVACLNGDELKLMHLVGISEAYLHRNAVGQTARIMVYLCQCSVKRFYLTLMLYQLFKRNSVWKVAERFQVSRGFLQQLLSSTVSFAACVLHFCQDLLINFTKKLSHCCSLELLPLMEIPGLKIGRARLLYEAGYSNVQQIASITDHKQLVRNVKMIPTKTAKQLISSARMLVNERLEELLSEAETLSTGRATAYS